MLESFDNLVMMAKKRPRKKLVVAVAEDEETLKAIASAYSDGIIEPILVGNKKEILKIAKRIQFNLGNITIFDVSNPKHAVEKAIAIIKTGKAEILMKGIVDTKTLLKGVLDKTQGLALTNKLSGIILAQIPNYHKLLAITDTGVILKPDINELLAIINNAVSFFHRLGIVNPKVALAAPVETINMQMESTINAALVTMMNRRSQIKDCLIDGPLALDNIISKEACKHKGIITEVGGDVDIIVVPDINAGNILVKALSYFTNAKLAGLVLGSTTPIVVTSRADNHIAKYLSIVCAKLIKN